LSSRAALLGGEIRHTELRAVQQATAATPGVARQLGYWIVNTPWVWPTCEIFHYFGLSLLFAVWAVRGLRAAEAAG